MTAVFVKSCSTVLENEEADAESNRSRITRRPRPLMPLVLALVPLSKFPIDFKILQWKCTLQPKDGLSF